MCTTRSRRGPHSSATARRSPGTGFGHPLAWGREARRGSPEPPGRIGGCSDSGVAALVRLVVGRRLRRFAGSIGAPSVVVRGISPDPGIDDIQAEKIARSRGASPGWRNSDAAGPPGPRWRRPGLGHGRHAPARSGPPAVDHHGRAAGSHYCTPGELRGMHRLTDPPASWSESSLEVPPSPAVAVLDPTDQMSALPSIPEAVLARTRRSSVGFTCSRRHSAPPREAVRPLKARATGAARVGLPLRTQRRQPPLPAQPRVDPRVYRRALAIQ